MKKMRFVLIFVLLTIMLTIALTGCGGKKEAEEVFVKVEDTKVCLLSQEPQKVELSVSVEDGNSTIELKTKVTVQSNKALELGLENITDANYFSDGAKIVSANVINHKQTIGDGMITLILFSIIFLPLVVGAIVICIKGIREESKRY